MSEVTTINLTFWNTQNYKYPGFGQTSQVSDGLGGTIGVTYNQIDYDDRAWKRKPDGDTPVTDDRFLSGEIDDKFGLAGKLNSITSIMPPLRTKGTENNYSVTLDFSNYKASVANSSATDGATSGDTYLAISRFFNGSRFGYTTIKVTAKTLDGSALNLAEWKLFNSGALPNLGWMGGHNARIFLDAATQTISGKNAQGKQEFCPTPPEPGSSFGSDTGLGLLQLPSSQRYTSITLTFKQQHIGGGTPNDLHDIYIASNTSSTGPAIVEPPIVDPVPQPIPEPVPVVPPVPQPAPNPSGCLPPQPVPEPQPVPVPQPTPAPQPQPTAVTYYVLLQPIVVPTPSWFGQPGMVIPGQPGSVIPGQPPFVIPGQPGSVIPGQPPFVIPGQPGAVIPGQPGSVIPGQPPFVIPGQPGAVIPGQPGSVIPGQPPFVIPGQPGAVIPGQPGAVIPGQPGAVIPGQPPFVIPGQPGAVIPGQPGAVIPGQPPFVIPGQPGAVIPGQPGAVIPGQPGAVIPGQPPFVIPGQPGAVIPGQPGAVIPGQPGAVIPGQPGAVIPGQGPTVIPGQPGAVIPGQPGAVIPGQPGAVIPGQPGAVIPGQGPTVIPGQPGAVIPGQPPTVIPGQPGAVIPGQPPTVIPGRPGAVIPGQSPTVIPGQAPTVIPGQSPTVIPGQPGAFIPGQSPTVIPGQPGAVIPGRPGMVIPGQYTNGGFSIPEGAIVPASATVLSISSVGIWSSVIGGETATGNFFLNGVGTNQISWGMPYYQGFQSAYRFDGVSSVVVALDGSAFTLGSFTHFNYPIAGDSITSATLVFTLNINGVNTEFNFTFRHVETANQGVNGTCPVTPGMMPPCPDVVLVENVQSQETVVINGKQYALNIIGFWQNNQLVTQMITFENQLNTAQLFAQWVEIPVEQAPQPVNNLKPFNNYVLS